MNPELIGHLITLILAGLTAAYTHGKLASRLNHVERYCDSFLQTTRDAQTHGERLNEHHERISRIDTKLDKLEADVAEIKTTCAVILETLKKRSRAR